MLLDLVLEKDHLSEAESRVCMKQILLGLQYLHSNGYAHRDLKLENGLLAKKGDLSSTKIADLGFAAKPSEINYLQVLGTPQYCSPEIAKARDALLPSALMYTSDMWSTGVILHIMLGGYPPFFIDVEEDTPKRAYLFESILEDEVLFDWHPIWQTVSEEAKSLITGLLTKDHTKRLTLSEALNHPFFTRGGAGGADNSHSSIVGEQSLLSQNSTMENDSALDNDHDPRDKRKSLSRRSQTKRSWWKEATDQRSKEKMRHFPHLEHESRSGSLHDLASLQLNGGENGSS